MLHMLILACPDDILIVTFSLVVSDFSVIKLFGWKFDFAGFFLLDLAKSNIQRNRTSEEIGTTKNAEKVVRSFTADKKTRKSRLKEQEK